MTLEQSLKAMKVHTDENPSHGLNCIHKDRFVTEIRNYLTDNGLLEEFGLVASYIK